MSKRINVTLYGFKLGRYVYYWRKKQLYRYNPRNHNTIIVKDRLYGGSLQRKIQKAYYRLSDLKDIITKVTITEFCPF